MNTGYKKSLPLNQTTLNQGHINKKKIGKKKNNRKKDHYKEIWNRQRIKSGFPNFGRIC
jgi:hypothetical protein